MFFFLAAKFSANPILKSATYSSTDKFRKPESRKQLLMRVLGGKKSDQEDNEIPEVKSGVLGDFSEDFKEEAVSVVHETPALNDGLTEQDNQESVRSELAVPFENDVESSGLDFKKSNVGKRDDVSEEGTTVIEPSFVSTAGGASSPVSLSPLEVEYLKKLREGPQPEVVTLTETSLRTETQYKTDLLTVMQKGRESVTTMVNPVGLTTVTDYNFVTSTKLPSDLRIAPSTTIFTSPVVFKTVITESQISEYNVRFRNEFITRTLVNTRVVTTITTTFATRTHAILPYHNTVLTLTESSKSPIHKRRTNILTRRRQIKF